VKWSDAPPAPNDCRRTEKEIAMSEPKLIDARACQKTYDYAVRVEATTAAKCRHAADYFLSENAERRHGSRPLYAVQVYNGHKAVTVKLETNKAAALKTMRLIAAEFDGENLDDLMCR
jgi:hypothetical protein